MHSSLRHSVCACFGPTAVKALRRPPTMTQGMELNNRIHRVDGVRGANCYLMPTAEGFYLIDTGMPGNAEKIIQVYEKAREN